ncbi:hypothetical protein GCM10027169_25650 [Gordonia jinhuaensis]|uniref:histidine kinase n=1 Tax=Gordonia jinhuaensis TaxID=1517702 RepID=A0A916TBM8_9ACTN|nr:HAMP domain-containing sensor histidine kinase [Gordonia jinhuaensis]GGB39035.1 hypothetical protein GCM10011489_28460 [Gordonia jinhuaensis]
MPVASYTRAIDTPDTARAPWQRRPRIRLGVRGKSTALAAAVVTVALGVAAAAMLLMLHNSNSSALHRATGRQAYQIATALGRAGLGGVDRDDLAPGAGVDITQVLDERGTVVASSPGAPTTPAVRPETGRSERGGTSNGTGKPQRIIDDVRLPGYSGEFSASVRSATHQGQRFTVVALDRADGIRGTEWTTAMIIAIELPVVVAAAATAVYLLVGNALRPVSRITTQVGDIGSDQLDRRVPVPAATDEIHTLATMMNDMLDRLQTSRDAQLRFVADASHELRSPLTTVVGLLDLATDVDRDVDLRTVRTILLPEAQRMQRMVDDLLLLARRREGVVLAHHHRRPRRHRRERTHASAKPPRSRRAGAAAAHTGHRRRRHADPGTAQSHRQRSPSHALDDMADHDHR